MFTFAFETWASLQLRHEDDSNSINLSEPSTSGRSGISPNQFCSDKNILSYKNFYTELMENFEKYKKDVQAFNAVASAFYESALNLWNNYTIENNIQQTYLGSMFENAVTRTKQKILRPLLTTSVKILDKINNVKDKIGNTYLTVTNTINGNNNESQVVQSQNSRMEIENDHGTGYYNDNDKTPEFSFNNKTLDMEIQTIDTKSETPSEPESKRIVEIKEMGQAHAQLVQLDYVNRLVDALEDYIHMSKANWQVTNKFVTYLVELNHDKLRMLNKRIGEVPAQNIKIRFLQPASNFYHRLMELYLQTISLRQIE